MASSPDPLHAALTRHERLFRWLLPASLAAVALAVLAMLADRGSEAPRFRGIVSLIDGLGAIWIGVFVLVTVPLVMLFVLRSVLAMGRSGELARLGGIVIVLHLACMTFGFWLAVGLSHWLLPGLFESGRLELASGPAVGTPGAASSHWDGLLALARLARDVGGRLMLPSLAVAVATGLLVLWRGRWLAPRLLAWLDRAVPSGLGVVVALLAFLPLSIFAVSYRLLGDDGWAVAATFLGFVVWQIAVIMLCILLLLLLAWIPGGIGPVRLVRALGPTWLLAATSRSSYACVAAATESALQTRRLPAAETEAAIPAILVTFRANRGITSVLTLLFLAHGFGLSVTAAVLASFFVLALVGSIGSPGLPGSTRLTTLPWYAAVGIPVEAYLFTKSIDDLPDIFKTVLNVTYPVVLLAVALRITSPGRQPVSPD